MANLVFCSNRSTNHKYEDAASLIMSGTSLIQVLWYQEHEIYTSCQVPSQSKFIGHYNYPTSFHIRKPQSRYLKPYCYVWQHNLDCHGNQMHTPLAAHELLMVPNIMHVLATLSECKALKGCLLQMQSFKNACIV